MAKWGEGDPRWIVEERADATNVNNWHWTEKNATGWSKEKLKTLLEGLLIEDDEYSCQITKLTKTDGEATANNRKAKLIFFYEWIIEADWKGKMVGRDTSYKGSLEIPNLSDENNADEIEVSVSVKTNNDAAYKVKEFMRIKGTEIIRQKMGNYISDLKQEFGQGMILPPKDKIPTQTTSSTQTSSPAPKVATKSKVTDKPHAKMTKPCCGRITDKHEFHCTPEDMYRVLTEPMMVKAFTRSNSEVVAEKGGKFSLFDGNVHGEFTELVPAKMLVMLWRHKTWPADHFSTVTLDFVDKSDGMEIVLTQTGVPEYDLERTKQGWQNHYWSNIKQTFGFGASLF